MYPVATTDAAWYGYRCNLGSAVTRRDGHARARSFGKPWQWWLVAALQAWPIAPAIAQDPPPATATEDLRDLSIEELMDLRAERVYSASRFEQKTTQAPAAVTVVTSDEIKQFGYRTLAEILKGVRGIYVTHDRNYANFGIRGFARPGDFNTRILLLLDGHRMNDNLYDSALMGTEAILDVDLIERVEVIRGPSSSIYGSNAFFGVVNVITRRAADIAGAEVSAEGGSLDTYKSRVTYGTRLDSGLEMMLSASAFDTGGNKRLYYPEFDSPSSNFGVAENSDAEDAQNLYARFTHGDLTLQAAHSRRDKQIPTASFGTMFNDGRERTRDERSFVELKYAHAYAGGTQLLGSVYYDRYGYTADYPYNYAGPSQPPFIVISHDDHYGSGVGADVQLTRKFRDRHTVIVGAEYREALKLYQSSYTDDPRTYGLQDTRDGRSLGLYAQGEFAVGEHLLVNTGLRYDKYENFSPSLSPRLGLIYSATPRTTAKLLYGEAYRVPNAYELYAESPGFSISNPDLEPETIQTYELVLEHSFLANLRVSASGYYYAIDDLISQETVGGLQMFQNRKTAHAKGLELELEGGDEEGLTARASYALQQAEDDDTGEELNNSPRHLAKVGLRLPLHRGGLFAGLDVQYSSSVKTRFGNRAPAFAVVNATLFSRELVENMELSATVYNLLDREYGYPGSTGHVQDVIPQDGRSFRLKLTYRFD